MAVTLTKSYQKISTISLTYGEIRTYAKYTSQNSTTNKTTYYLKSTYYTSYSTLSFSSATAKLDGTSKNYGSTTLTSGETTLQEVSRTITHNTNGTSPEKTVKTEWSATFGGSGSKSATIKMPTINRIATVTSATDFTDESNPTVSFSNPAGFKIYPYLNFYDNAGTKVYGLSRKSSSASSPYTWSITDDEREALRKVTNKQKTYKVSVGVETYNGSTYLGYNSVSKTMSYVNANPTESTAFEETNQKVIDILGNSTADTIIQNVSSLKLTSMPTALKESTVSKVQFQHNNVIVAKTSSPYEHMFKPVNSVFKTTITDSRGYVVSNEYTKDIIEYLPIEISSFSFKRANPTSSDVVLNAQIRYKQAKFGENDNVPTIQWKCGENGELYTLTVENYALDTENNRITISNLTLSDILPYTQESRFYLYACDLLTEDTENEPVLKGIPTCDMGEHDFQVNGELYIADKSRANKKEIRDLIYPIGSIYMSVNSTSPATLFGGTWERIQGRFLLAANDNNATYNAGKTGGSVTKTLTVANLPSHDHGASAGNFISTSSSASPGTEMSFEAGSYRRYAMSKTGKTGSGTALDIMPPWIAVYVWKRTA